MRSGHISSRVVIKFDALLVVIQFAKLSGFSPIITTASAKHESYLKSIGATHVVDRNTPLSELSAVVKKLTNAPLQYVYDAVSSAETQNAAFDALADGGHLAIVLGDAVDKKKPADGKEVVNVVCVVQGENQRAVGRELYKHFTALLEAGDIKVRSLFVPTRGRALNEYISQITSKCCRMDSQAYLEASISCEAARSAPQSLWSASPTLLEIDGRETMQTSLKYK